MYWCVLLCVLLCVPLCVLLCARACILPVGFVNTQLEEDERYVVLLVLHILYGAFPSHHSSYTPEQAWLDVHAVWAADREV